MDSPDTDKLQALRKEFSMALLEATVHTMMTSGYDKKKDHFLIASALLLAIQDAYAGLLVGTLGKETAQKEAPGLIAQALSRATAVTPPTMQ